MANEAGETHVFMYRADADIPSAQLEALRRRGIVPVRVKILDSAKMLAMPIAVPQASLDLMLEAAAATFVQFTDTSAVAGRFGIELSKRLLTMRGEKQ